MHIQTHAVAYALPLPCGDVHRCTEETVTGATGANASPVFTLFSCGPSQPTVVP